MITSTSNARIKRLVNLKKKRKLRDEEGVFLVEGIRMFREVPLDKLKEVYVSESFYKKEKDTVKEVLKDSNKSGGTDRYRILTCVRYQDPAGHPVRGGADESQNQRTDFSRVSADHGIRSSAGSG